MGDRISGHQILPKQKQAARTPQFIYSNGEIQYLLLLERARNSLGVVPASLISVL